MMRTVRNGATTRPRVSMPCVIARSAASSRSDSLAPAIRAVRAPIEQRDAERRCEALHELADCGLGLVEDRRSARERTGPRDGLEREELVARHPRQIITSRYEVHRNM